MLYIYQSPIPELLPLYFPICDTIPPAIGLLFASFFFHCFPHVSSTLMLLDVLLMVSFLLYIIINTKSNQIQKKLA